MIQKNSLVSYWTRLAAWVSEERLLIGIFIAGLILRLVGLFHGVTFHPDERHIIMTTQKMSWEELNPHFFAYGSLPFFLLFFVSQLVGTFSSWGTSYEGLFILGRGIAVLITALTICAVYLLGKALSGRKEAGVIAALAIACNTLHIQLSHFYTVDIFLGLFTPLFFLCLWKGLVSQKFRYFLCAAFFYGISIGTKVSALSMGFPLILALIWLISEEVTTWRRISLLQRLQQIFLRLVLLGSTTFVAFFLVEPHPVLDFFNLLSTQPFSLTQHPEQVWKFYHDNKEQIDMVKGVWHPPYTLQYVHTTSYWYPLQQMWSYTMGVPLFILASLGAIWAIFRHKTVEQLIALWCLTVFFIIGQYEVKFPRYLLPLYPVLFTLGAAALATWYENTLSSFSKRIGEAIFYTFTSAVVIKALTLSSLYLLPHTYELASRWIYSHIPAHSRILGVHWDDKLPIDLPGFSSHQYQMWGENDELPFYDGESEQGYAKIVDRLSTADYLIFPTDRIPGSITRLPEQYQKMNALLRQLYGGGIGYQLIQTIKLTPSIGILSWDDRLADESFSVYDHPRVSIFKNIQKFSREEILQRIAQGRGDSTPATREELLLIEGGTTPDFSQFSSHLSSLVFWLMLAEAFFWLAVPVTAQLFPQSADRGLGFARIVGPFLFTYICWLCSSLLSKTGISVLSSSGLLTLLLALFAGWGFLLKREEFRVKFFLFEYRQEIIRLQCLWYGVFLGVAVITAWHPEIFWGEKPMDFTFLNYFHRLETLPPQDPWAAGHTMAYYYFGPLLISVFTKLTHTSPSVGYLLAFPLLAGMLCCGAYSLISFIREHSRGAVFASLALIFLANYQTLLLYFAGKYHLNFDLFWATTRVYTEPAFTEYPLWSLLFMDLHAHVIALPFTFIVLALTLRLLDPVEGDSPEFFLTRGFLGVSLGILFMTNAWDAIAYGALIAVVSVVTFFRDKRLKYAPLKVLGEHLLSTCYLGVCGFLSCTPFLAASTRNPELGYGRVVEGFNTLPQILGMHGHWILICLVLFPLLIIWSTRFDLFSKRWLTLGPVIILCLVLPLWIKTQESPSLGILFTGALLSIPIIPLLLSQEIVLCRIGITLFMSVALLIGAEYLFLSDRMNTIFKFYIPLWFVLGITALVLIEEAVQVGTTSSRFTKVLVSLLLIPCCLSTILILYSYVPFQRIEGPRPTLDGTAYLTYIPQGERPLYEYMNHEIHGTPTLLEAFGDSYQDYTRVSMFTGLPTVLGWEHHVWQRGVSREEILERKTDIQRFYLTTNLSDARAILEKYNVQYVVVGPQERRLYTGAGLFKFENSLLFQPIVRTGISTLYQVVK